MFPPRGLVLAVFSVLVACGTSVAQSASKSLPDAATSAQKATTLAKDGHCAEALPLLKRSIRQVEDAKLKRTVGLSGVHCAMALGQVNAALDFLQSLARSFPRDPEILYTEVHVYSDLSSMSSQELAHTAPSSPQAHELLAESYEAQGNWAGAEKEYRAIIEHNPNLPGIHFRLGRLLLSKPNPPTSVAEDAKHEFEQELVIDPSNAGAEYVLGELARQNSLWDEAVKHFSRAATLDAHFSEAYLGLGMSLMSLKRYSEAVTPLETAVRLDPKNPDAHYNLATAYTRAGRKEDGEREFAIHQKLIGTQGGAAEQPAAQAQDDKK
jgi:Tfp pilus assembly protein PilF